MTKIIIGLLVLCIGVFALLNSGTKRKTGISGGGSTVQPTQTASLSGTASSVPLPTAEDVIRTFVQLINDQKISDAIAMMDSTLVSSDSEKQQYGVVFNSFAAMTLSKIVLDSSSPGEERYRVDITITKKPNGTQNLWDAGVNTRWITVKKNDTDHFMIHDIATGP